MRKIPAYRNKAAWILRSVAGRSGFGHLLLQQVQQKLSESRLPGASASLLVRLSGQPQAMRRSNEFPTRR